MLFSSVRSGFLLGIINLHKPTGKTSHDMVSLVRRTLGLKRVGHTGTLDPEASGVLPVLVGKATGLSEMLTEKTKGYTARVRLGIATDTYDLAGVITGRSDVIPAEEEIKAAAKAFIGRISQLPPMYSAIKQNGKKLYELARQGIEVEREAREVEIYDLRCYDFSGDEFSLDVTCSKGTYIRSLCYDLGRALGTYATMASLVRTKSGIFTLENAITPEELVEKVESGGPEAVLLPPEVVLEGFPAIDVPSEMAARVKNGLRYRTGQLGIPDAKEGERYRLYENGNLFCLSKVVPGEGSLVLANEVGFY